MTLLEAPPPTLQCVLFSSSAALFLLAPITKIDGKHAFNRTVGMTQPIECLLRKYEDPS